MNNFAQTVRREAGFAQGVVLLLAAVMPAMAIVTLVPVLPLLGREFGALPGSAFLIPMALTVPALCVALFSPFAGWLSDKVGRKTPLIIALLLYAVVGVAPYFMTDFYQILASRVALGVCEAMIMTIATAMLGDYFVGARRQRWISAQVGVVSVSAIALIAAGGFLGEALGSRGPFLLYVLAVPMALVVGFVLFEPAERLTQAKGRLPIAKIFPLLLVTLVTGILFYTTIVKLGPILLLTGEVSPATIGLVGALVNAGVVAGSVLFNFLKRLSGPVLLTMGMVFFSVGFTGIWWSTELTYTVVFAVCTTIGSGLLLPTLVNWVLALLPDAVRGSGTGLWTGTFFLGQFVAPLLVSAIEKPVNGLANVALVWAGVAVLIALISLFNRRSSASLS